MRAFLLDPYRLGFMGRALVEVLLLGTLGGLTADACAAATAEPY